MGVQRINDHGRLCVLIIQFHSLDGNGGREGREGGRKNKEGRGKKKQINIEEAEFLRGVFFFGVCFLFRGGLFAQSSK